ncbi:hypothetical protein FACS189429_4970 [Bacteroidia bacterium]|nr:hypothetical protein FACS189429_4970 [Bacteroidia bacterium]
MKIRPKIKFIKTPFDWCVETATSLFLLAHWFVVLLFYFKLPETIPVHYNGVGEIDGWGSKSTIWLLPVISTLSYIGFHFLQILFDNIYDEQSSEILCVKIFAVMKMSLILCFTLIDIQILQDALNTFWFMRFGMLYAVLVLMGIAIVYYTVKMLIVYCALLDIEK